MLATLLRNDRLHREVDGAMRPAIATTRVSGRCLLMFGCCSSLVARVQPRRAPSAALCFRVRDRCRNLEMTWRSSLVPHGGAGSQRPRLVR